MSTKGNSANLRIVKAASGKPDEIELLTAGGKQPRTLRIVERDVSEAQISLQLSDCYALDLRLLPNGRIEEPHAIVGLLFKGKRLSLRGRLTMPDGDVVLPRGTLAAWEALAA